jgi:hypothetical protein
VSDDPRQAGAVPDSGILLLQPNLVRAKERVKQVAAEKQTGNQEVKLVKDKPFEQGHIAR